jgi:hypothetical protein
LDIHSARGADNLTDFVAEEILSSVGSITGNSEELVKIYKEKYAKSYT